MPFLTPARLVAATLAVSAFAVPTAPAVAAPGAKHTKKLDATSVNGLRASRTPKPGRLVALDKNGKLPLAALPAKVAALLLSPTPQVPGPKGDKGDPGATGTVDTSNFYTKSDSDARFLALAAKAADANLLDGRDSGDFLQIHPATAQQPRLDESDAALWLRNTVDYGQSNTPATSEFRVGGDGSLLSTSTLGIGIIPASGCGDRIMWYAFKASFRAGSPGECPGSQNFPGTAWDDANQGFYSWAGGVSTTASGLASLAMGDSTAAVGTDSVALGSNTRAGGGASLAMGLRAGAFGTGSVALGTRAVTASGCPVTGSCDLSAIDPFNGFSGSFVWSDSSSPNMLAASATNQFTARAANGFRFFTNAGATTGCALPAGSGVFSCTSDRHAKHAFRPVDGQDVLRRLAHVPITSWQYKSEPGRVRHMGPMAQDFRRAFGLGTDDKHIGSIDEDGVTMAAIKALYATTQRQAREIGELKRQLAAVARH
jgi:hypothetical protein